MSSVVKGKRTLLHDEPSIVLQPEMVRRLGNLTDAAVLQQLNYWMPHAKVLHEGRKWVFKTYENWSKEIGVSHHQVRRSMDRLEQIGLVESCTPRGRTKHYAINYEHPMLDEAYVPDSNVADLPDDVAPVPDDVAGLPTYKDLQETKEEKNLAAAPRQSVRKNDGLFDKIAEVCGYDTSTLTKSARGQLNKAVKELREVGADADQVGGKAAAYKEKYPGMDLTPTALIKHWAALYVRKVEPRQSIWDTYDPPESYYS